MKYIECPEEYKIAGDKSIFLAGGISNCNDWQEVAKNLLKPNNLTVINPRRADFDVNDPNCSAFQIEWEHRHLKLVDAVAFWFPWETLCPITLFELGKVLSTDKDVFVGVHPAYKRKFDIEHQVKLMRPEIRIVNDLEELINQVDDWELRW